METCIHYANHSPPPVEALHNNSDLFGDSSSSNEVNDIDDNSFNDASSGRSLQDGSVQSQLQSGVVESGGRMMNLQGAINGLLLLFDYFMD